MTMRGFLRGMAGAAAAAVLATGAMGCGTESKCKSDFDCPTTQVCKKATGVCEAFVCDGDSDCAEKGATCVDNACVQSSG